MRKEKINFLIRKEKINFFIRKEKINFFILTKKLKLIKFNDNKVSTVLISVVCIILGFKSKKKHGYDSIIMGYNPRLLLWKCNIVKITNILEIKYKDPSFEFGSLLDISNFSMNETLNIMSKSKGKGFSGAMKRYNFSGLRSTHGVSTSHRSIGATGSNQDPGKVWKGKLMAGRMGNKNITLKNLKILNLNKYYECIVISGIVPGCLNSDILIKNW